MRRLRTLAFGGIAAAALAGGLTAAHADSSSTPPSSTPIKHVVVIFGENISFDHYFGTYPNAVNPAGEPRFEPKPGTPSVNGLNDALLTNNPNSANPARLDRSQAVTCSQNHGYGSEQQAFDGGLMDGFVEHTAGGSCTDKSIVMDYYDGNTVTGLWNLAQNFALNDNSFSTQFGPSTVGALSLVSGQTHGATPPSGVSGVENGTVIGDPDPSTTLDDCANGSVVMSGRNIGDLLNAHHLTWGWFEGGFRPTSTDTTTGRVTCASRHVNVAGGASNDYVPHHDPFEYYASTANPHHLPPSRADMIGQTDQANHQYDLTDFDTALSHDDLPAVSFLKAAAFEDGHPSNSDPLDEQRFVARTIDAIEQSPEWDSTAIVLAYDDSDGWYDHVMSPIVSPSNAPSDALNGAGVCGRVKDPNAYPDRCGYGPRQPLMVVSPFAKRNFVDNTLTDQSSIIKFVEDNWQLGRIGDQSMDAQAGSLGNMLDFDPNAPRAPKVFIDPTTGLVTNHPVDSGPPAGGGGDPGDGGHGHDGGGQGGGQGASGNPSHGAGGEGKHARISVRCTTSGPGHGIAVSCRVSGADAKHGRTSLRFRLVHGRAVIASTRALVHGSTASATLHPRHQPRSGRYTLKVAIAHSDGSVASAAQAVRLG